MKNWMMGLVVLISSCATHQKLREKSGTIPPVTDELLTTFLTDSAVSTGHTGICIYEPATGNYIYRYNANKFFTPASNVKLFTMYAAMKHLGDSLQAASYCYLGSNNIGIIPFADPSFLHPDFKFQPLMDFFEKNKDKEFQLEPSVWKSNALGNGWMWDDFNLVDMTERSPLPVFGNVAQFTVDSVSYKWPNSTIHWHVVPGYFKDYVDRTIYMPGFFTSHPFDSSKAIKSLYNFKLIRQAAINYFSNIPSEKKFEKTDIPFVTDGLKAATGILRQQYNYRVRINSFVKKPAIRGDTAYQYHSILSQPIDTLLKPMMHRSDNFFAEQLLLMVSNKMLGYMSDSDVIDSLLSSDLKDLPQKPAWADGSGLSRYNLSTPENFVWLLTKMNSEFGLQRLQNILVTGGAGTLKNSYKQIPGAIFAKTGSLRNNCAISGYLITRQNRLFVFSVLNNNFATGSAPVKRAVENFIVALYEKY